MKKTDVQGYLTILFLIVALALAGALERPPQVHPIPPQKIIVDHQGEPQLVTVARK